ncbi:uncharacterized protein LOC127259257 isoform X1 [Andrographis paniculata]|uniref:uncharacterized protein LOC127259257 isoform X1 n=1 Tax=Andrographis paniculata TaxID=175694 RepID=UPI0021E75A44|nr:uncharacterized protein LOC127259257 isoform X1 [Andrographis paniculata]
MGSAKSPWLLQLSITFAVASVSASAAISLYLWRRKSKSASIGESNKTIQQLEASVKAALEKCAAERKGRIRAQQALREAMCRQNQDKPEFNSYPMTPIAVVRSCFSTRNGTPRQPLLVPLAKASLLFDYSRVPQASLQGLEGYSHCWIIYVFHLNTDLNKLWKHPSQSRFKAKVRVPRLKGERVGVFATRSPHRLCPIGLTVAKVEAVHGHVVLLSGVDLVDGTPVLDIKPYLPYCDSIQDATVPDWVKVDSLLAVSSVNFSESFFSNLNDCWLRMENKSLYSSPDEFMSLIRQVLSWDIRSVSQRNRTDQSSIITKAASCGYESESTIASASSIVGTCLDDETIENEGELHSPHVVYHVILEGLDVSYRIDSSANIHVEKVTFASSRTKGQ